MRIPLPLPFLHLAARLLILCAACSLLSPAVGARVVEDAMGRRVNVPDKVERIVLGEQRFLIALGILEGEALLQRVVGTMSEFTRLDPDGYAQYLARFPALAKLPRVGQTSSDTFSVEQALALRPQVAVFSLGGGHGPGPMDTELLRHLEAAGVAVVFIDFRRDPLANTTRSMRVLGEVLGREKEARAFIDFYEAELARVRNGLQGVTQKPRVFLESRVGLREECCETMVGGMMGRFIEVAGGDNIARSLVPGEVGTVNPEFLLTQQPDFYIATAIGNRAAGPQGSRRILMGAGVKPEEARASLQASLKRPAIAGLAATRSGHAYAIWHHFYDSPFNVVAAQAFAKWFHPQRFAALDPAATLKTLYQRFQPVALDGTYWTVAP